MDIAISKLTKTYRGGVRALAGIDLNIQPGMFGLLGPNGAGKTTLMRILVGLIRPSSGSVTIGGHDVTREPGKTRVRRTLGYLPQDAGFYPDLTARQFTDYMAILKQINDSTARKREVDSVLARTNLTEVADRRIKGFSGGMKRRLGIAQALLGNPQLLIVDEPTAGLDPEERIRFRNLLADLAADRLVVLSSHVVEDIAQTCRELAVIHSGRVRFSGSPDALLANAKESVWELELPAGQRVPEAWSVVSTIHMGQSVRYRLVGDTSPAPGARSVTPSLEDAYVHLMRDGRTTHEAAGVS